MSFGKDTDIEYIRKNFQEGVLDPLDNIKKEKPENVKDSINYEYYIKVVPTTYKTIHNKEYYVHQFTANTNEYKTQGMPAVYFKYDLSPVTVKFSQV